MTLVIRIFVTLFLSPPFLTAQSQSAETKPKTLVQSIGKAEMSLLKMVDRKYQKEHGIHLKLKKTVKIGLLGSSRESEGEAWLNQGLMRLEIQKPEVSKMISTAKYFWIENAPPEGFKDIKTQVMKAELNTERAKSQGLIQLLTKGGVLKYFRVSGVQKAKDTLIYFLQPHNQALEFKRAQILVSPKTKTIEELKYWDQMDNETTYSFTASVFNQKLDPKKFEYTPPADAEIITY